MRKFFAVFLVVILMLTITSCRFNFSGSTSTDISEVTTPTEPRSVMETQVETQAETQTETQAPKIGTIDDYIGIYNQTTLDYTDGVGNHYTPSYTVPEIKLQSSDAIKVNDKIQSECMKLIDESVEYSKQKTSLICTGIEYDAWMNDNLVTLIVTIKNDWNVTHYMVYTLDVLTGEELDNDDISEDVLRISDDELDTKIKDTMLDYFVTNTGGDKNEFYYDQLEKTISDDNIDDAEVYFDENGNLFIHCTIYSIAGADKYEHLIEMI